MDVRASATRAGLSSTYTFSNFPVKVIWLLRSDRFEAIRQRLGQADKAELDEEELSVSCQDLAAESPYEDVPEVAAATELRLRVEPLRLPRLSKCWRKTSAVKSPGAKEAKLRYTSQVAGNSFWVAMRPITPFLCTW